MERAISGGPKVLWPVYFDPAPAFRTLDEHRLFFLGCKVLAMAALDERPGGTTDGLLLLFEGLSDLTSGHGLLGFLSGLLFSHPVNEAFAFLFAQLDLPIGWRNS